MATVGVAGAIAISGGSPVDPRMPPLLPGLPPPFLGTAVIGGGGATAAVDAYGNVVDLRRGGAAGGAAIAIPPERQAAGTVPADAGRVARAQIGGRRLPFWRAESVRQRYLPGTNVLVTVARFGGREATVVRSIGPPAVAARRDRRWLRRARRLGGGAPDWARRMHARSLLVLRALIDRRSGAVAAGAREGWAYVWPRDAAAVAIALASAGYRGEARRIVDFLRGLDLAAAARFDGDGQPVDGRDGQGDAAGWVAAAARAAGVDARIPTPDWHGRADYQEKSSGDYLANAIASAGAGGGEAGPPPDRFPSRHRESTIRALFEVPAGLVREAGDPGSGLDSAAAWAVRPFALAGLYPAARRTLRALAAEAGRFGIVPSRDWPGRDPWTAPTAWTAWGLAALAREAGRARDTLVARRDRHAALRLMAALRRTATPLGTLPERVDARTGVPTSTTPLAWSHAFAILALRELWPGVR